MTRKTVELDDIEDKAYSFKVLSNILTDVLSWEFRAGKFKESQKEATLTEEQQESLLFLAHDLSCRLHDFHNSVLAAMERKA